MTMVPKAPNKGPEPAKKSIKLVTLFIFALGLSRSIIIDREKSEIPQIKYIKATMVEKLKKRPLLSAKMIFENSDILSSEPKSPLGA